MLKDLEKIFLLYLHIRVNCEKKYGQNRGSRKKKNSDNKCTLKPHLGGDFETNVLRILV